MAKSPARRKMKVVQQDPDVAVEGSVEGDLYVAGGDINVTNLSREDRLLLRTRTVLIDKVDQFWIEGVLNKSLHGVAMFDLGMKTADEAVMHPWEAVVQSLDPRKTTTVPEKDTILNVFDAMNKALLILGHPGTGKTITLLELCKELIDRALADEDQPIPVIFNLSTWHGGTISAWLVDELADKYGVPRETGEQWVDDDELAALLDGLDEVPADFREDCLEAINKFRVTHGIAPIAVTCRLVEYQAIGKQLNLEGAVTLQLLTDKQVDQYLKHTGDEYASLRKAIKEDPALHELAQTPLMLTVMMLAYRGVDIQDIPGGNNVNARRKHLFDTYIERMLSRHPAKAAYSVEDTLHYLQWIARRMTEDSASMFMLEKIQPRWLESRFMRWLYGTAQRVVGIPLLAVWSSIITVFVVVLMQTVLAGLTLERSFAAVTAPVIGSGLFFGLVIGLIVGRGAHSDILPIEALRWSWGWSWAMARIGAIAGLAVCLAVAIISFFFLGYFPEARNAGGLVMWFAMGRHLLFWWLLGIGNAICWAILFGLLLGGLKAAEIETTRPNQGIINSVRLGTVVGLGVVIGLGLLLIPMVTSLQYFGYHEAFQDAMAGGSLTGMSIAGLAGFVMGLRYGALPVIQHLTVRILLRLVNALPIRLVHFLDYTSELIFTRRVGGGFIFVHRLLLEHMAGPDWETVSIPAAKGGTVTGATELWFVPANTRRKLKPTPVRQITQRIGIGAAVVMTAALVILMLSAVLVPNLYAFGGTARLGGVRGAGYTPNLIGWSPDSANLATIQYDETHSTVRVDVWDAATGDKVNTRYPGGFSFSRAGSVSPDGRFSLTTQKREPDGRGTETDLLVWNLTNGQLIQQLDFPEGGLWKWSPDSDRVAIGWTGHLEIWDPLHGRLEASGEHDLGSVFHIVWAGDAKKLSMMSPEGIVVTFNAADGEPVATFAGDGSGVGAFSPDGTTVALEDTSSDVGYSIYDLTTGDKLSEYKVDVPLTGTLSALTWSPNGKRISVQTLTLSGSYLITNRDVVSGAELSSMTISTLLFSGFSWSPDGDQFTLVTTDGHVGIFNVEGGAPAGDQIWAPTKSVFNLITWAPDGKRLVGSGVDGESAVVTVSVP